MPYRKLEARIHNRAVMETKNDENAPQATYKMCMDTARTLGQGTLVHIQGRLHSIDPGTTLRISAYTGCLCSGEEPSIIRTAIDAPWVRRLENSSCACVHIP